MKKSVNLIMLNSRPHLVTKDELNSDGLIYVDPDGNSFKVIATPDQIGWFSVGDQLIPKDQIMLSDKIWYHRVDEEHVQKIINNNSECKIIVHNGEVKLVAGRVLIEI